MLLSLERLVAASSDTLGSLLDAWSAARRTGDEETDRSVGDLIGQVIEVHGRLTELRDQARMSLPTPEEPALEN